MKCNVMYMMNNQEMQKILCDKGSILKYFENPSLNKQKVSSSQIWWFLC